MRQRRLECYFTPTRPPYVPLGRSFHDLPRSIRKIIYSYAGLDNLFIDLNYSNLKVYARDMYPDTADCVKFTPHKDWPEIRKVDVGDFSDIWEFCEDLTPKTYQYSMWNCRYSSHQSMLLVSKGLYEEVEAFIYSGATFRVCLGQPLGFTRLWRMNGTALSNLVSLTIRLDAPKTIVKSRAWAVDASSLPVPIDLSLGWGKLILKEWTSILERLSKFIRPSFLSLRVVFRAKTIEDVRGILMPLFQLPPLKDCAICADLYGQDYWWRQCDNTCSRSDLHCFPYKTTELSNLIQQTIQKLTQRPCPDPAFRYLDLPQELRWKILEYTDLVSSEVVQWRPRVKLSVTTAFYHCIQCGGRSPSTGHEDYCICDDPRPRYPPTKVAKCGESYSCCSRCRLDDHSSICYCSRLGPIWSSSCKCLLPRHPLFSVSSQIRQEATKVYYAHNQILITPYHSPILRLIHGPYALGIPYLGSRHIPKIELSLYLSFIASNALQHIRWLEWAVPPQNFGYLLPKTPAWYDYLDTLLLMENAMRLSALTFTINFMPLGGRAYMPPHEHDCRWYEMLILPVQRLGIAGLKDFFLYIRWYDSDHVIVHHHEKKLERAVMGKGYDSSSRGKPEDRVLKVYIDRLRAEGF